MIKTIDLNIGIDSTGLGRAVTKRINGYLLLIALPKNRVQQTEVRISPESLPDLQIKLPKKENVFRLKIDAFDSEGRRVQNMEDLPLDDRLVVEVYAGIPNSTFSVKIIYDG